MWHELIQFHAEAHFYHQKLNFIAMHCYVIGLQVRPTLHFCIPIFVIFSTL